MTRATSNAMPNMTVLFGEMGSSEDSALSIVLLSDIVEA